MSPISRVGSAATNSTGTRIIVGFIALNRDCANGNTAEYRGSKCNPLFLTTEYTNNKDARKRKLTFKQEQRDLIGASIYKGKMPELANEAASAPTEEEGA